ncbi:YdeI/OmpD-associated family protein [uncultured Brevundimonas sp.]|uniref:YdeI/OmpD-associated family protein n=1 Tax=uncultured Brevundimonas sp. TaxID=213418 RepID=UPI0030EF75B6|tara:strand:+ start:228 stop:524 length:297 start_codon:yes stop_codon:yes gene_type:complete
MTGMPISAGVVHALPEDLRARLVADPAALERWEDITPLARNEWICWIESVKRDETRRQHIERACADLKAGKRRPCCWPGCPHREKGAGSRGPGQSVRS